MFILSSKVAKTKGKNGTWLQTQLHKNKIKFTINF